MKNKKKRKIWNLVIILLAAVGSILLLYPSANFWFSQRVQSYAVQKYDDGIEKMNAEQLEAEWEQAVTYNKGLSSYAADPFAAGSLELSEEYLAVLNINEDGIMGHIKIPSINVRLPIYHGTSEEVLNKGAGHLSGSNLPIGGEGNHAVLTGHTGLTTAKLFTDLAKMEVGETFYIVILDRTLAYKVEQILVVEPSETEALRAVEGEDYVTLVTCTPYGINSHRLFVRGTRIPFTEEDEKKLETKAELTINWKMVMISLFAIAMSVVFVRHKIRKRRRCRKDQPV